MNRINSYHKRAIINYTRCKTIYFNFQNTITYLLYQKAIGEVNNWCAIKETIRKGYKRVME